jgi:hypothetical protein
LLDYTPVRYYSFCEVSLSLPVGLRMTCPLPVHGKAGAHVLSFG